MHLEPVVAALGLVVAPPATAARVEPAPVEVTDPMASFARLVGGEWSGMAASHAWSWGPGNRSIRRMTHGSASSTWDGEVLYWHPGLGQVRMLSLHGDIPGVGRGVAEATIRVDGDTTDAVFDLYQPRGPRKLAQRQRFEGADKYRHVLLEDTAAGFQTLGEWDLVRTNERSEPPSPTAEQAPLELPEHMKFFGAVLDGGTWEAKGDSASGDAFRIHSTVEWVSSLEVVFARIHALSGDGESKHVLEAYVYRHIGTGALRCLALSDRGAVYEGDVAELDGGALQLDLKGYEGDKVVPHVVQLDLEQDGTLRSRVWSLEGTDRKLMLDVHHKKLEPKKE